MKRIIGLEKAEVKCQNIQNTIAEGQKKSETGAFFTLVGRQPQSVAPRRSATRQSPTTETRYTVTCRAWRGHEGLSSSAFLHNLPLSTNLVPPLPMGLFRRATASHDIIPGVS